jgi:hypothetical protein
VVQVRLTQLAEHLCSTLEVEVAPLLQLAVLVVQVLVEMVEYLVLAVVLVL